MEADLRSSDPSQRTLHWFVNGEQQGPFIKGVPDHVQFAVCTSLIIPYFFFFLSSSFKISLYGQGDTVEFIKFEELLNPQVHPIPGQTQSHW